MVVDVDIAIPTKQSDALADLIVLGLAQSESKLRTTQATGTKRYSFGHFLFSLNDRAELPDIAFFDKVSSQTTKVWAILVSYGSRPS